VLKDITIKHDVLLAETAIVLAIKYVRNLAGVMDVVGTVEQSLDGFKILEKALEPRDNGEVAEHAARFSSGGVTVFVAKRAFSEFGMSVGVGDTGINTAIKPEWLDAREDRHTMEHDPFRAQAQLVGESIDHLVVRRSWHF
jgi:hypothetical protein